MDKNKFLAELNLVYGWQTAEAVLQRLLPLLEEYRGRLPSRRGGLSQRDSILITYPDQVQEEGSQPLRLLADFCARHFAGVVNGIHILPFYPWTSDDGFSVVDYRSVAPEYGNWDDIRSGLAPFRLMFDAVINHASVESEWFKGFLLGELRYERYFIVPPDDADLSKVVRPRALPLLTTFQTARGERKAWTTFSADQVDLNYGEPEVLLEIVDVLLLYALHGAQFVRMDAIAYLWKQPGTTCIHLPQTHALIRLFRLIFDELAPEVSIITETNVPHAENISYFGDGRNEAQLVYNFSLPPLVLHAFQSGSAELLSEWASTLKLPSDQVTFFNFLASHDGIGLNPLRGILPEAEISRVVQRTQQHGGLVSFKSEADGTLRPYELNINYFDALNDPGAGEPLERQVARFTSAHAILLSLRGVPGIYFHSLVGSRGWPEGVQETGRNRSINRQKLREAELEALLADVDSREHRVFEKLAGLLRLRSESAAFHPLGKQRVLDCGGALFALERTAPDGSQRMLCLQNVSDREQLVQAGSIPQPNRPGSGWRDGISGRSVPPGIDLRLEPFEVLWLT